MSDYPMLISNKLHSFRNFLAQVYDCLRNKMIPIVAYQANDFKVAP